MSFNLDPQSYMLSRSMSMRDENDFATSDQPLEMFPQPYLGDISDFDLDEALSLNRPASNSYFPAVDLTHALSYHEMAQFQAAQHSPTLPFIESPELRAPPSNLSTASGPSASSSRIGSPYSNHGQTVPPYEWSMSGLGVTPGIVNYDAFGAQDYNTFSHIENDYGFVDVSKPDFVGECRDDSTDSQSAPNTFPANEGRSASLLPLTTSNVVHYNFEACRFEELRTLRTGSPSSTTSTSQGPAILTPDTSSSDFSPASTRRCSVFSAAASQHGSPMPRDVSSISPVAPFETTGERGGPGGLPLPRFYQSPFFSQTSGQFVLPLQSSYPSLINGYSNPIIAAPMEMSQYQQQIAYPPLASPALSQHSSHGVQHIKKCSVSPYFQPYPYPPPNRRPSIVSRHSFDSQESSPSGEEPRVKGRCADCAKVFKDLKAHMLTHQNERPEKCPIATCEYHTKGFARKYDKNRHTLTHYKGTMVCGFCPGSGSSAEKSFNRADVFKRHLTSVHAVEQTAPHSRKKVSGSSASKKTLAGYGPDATGKCSTCSAVFNNAQDFYEHLDDCVLRVVQQEEPSEAINKQRLAEVEHDTLVHDTLRKNNLPVTTSKIVFCEEDEDEYDDDDEIDDNDYNGQSKARGKASISRVGVNGAVCKTQSGAMTHSKGGVALHSKGGRKKRKDFPSSWGCAQSQMKMKKRVMVAFDGTRRLWKDDMMLSTEFELRLPLADGKSYVTDLDVQTIKRAAAFHDATEEERGPDLDLQQIDLEMLMNIKKEDV